MDFLKAEISRKRKLNDVLRQKLANTTDGSHDSADAADNVEITVKSKFIRLGDRMKMEEMELLEKQQHLDEERRKKQQKIHESQRKSAVDAKQKAEVVRKAKNDEQNEQFDTVFAHMADSEVKQRLRQLRQPITLFGEVSEDRLARLIILAKRNLNNEISNITTGMESEYRVGRNASFDEKEEAELEAADKEDTAHSKTKKGTTKPSVLGTIAVAAGGYGDASDDDDGKEDEEEDEDGDKNGGGADNDDARKADMGLKWDHTVHFSEMPGLTAEKVVYKFFRALLKQWESDLDEREDAVKRTAKGKTETRTQKQCKDHIRPLFRMCKTKEVPRDILEKLLLMVRFCEEGNFLGANDQYIQAAIGKSAWPIGLTMVGIHERSGRERISTSKVAHIMNNELERKYLTSVKRLLTFAQSKRPDVAPSMKVLTR